VGLSRKVQSHTRLVSVEGDGEMNKPITSNKFVTDLWSMTQMLIDEAVLAEREACAKVADGWPDYDVQGLAEAIRARGQT
jgi:hypothetical protein